MWFMRVVLALVVGVAVALGPGPALAQGLKLTWWEHANPPHNAYSKDLVAEYNQGSHGASVDYEVFPMTPFFKKLTVAISTKTAPDMYTVTDFLLPSLVAKKGVASLNPQWLGYQSLEEMKAAYLPGALNGYIYDGKIYAVPVIAQTMSLYLNRRHFEEAGLDPEKDYPRTWDDLARVGKKLVKMEGGKIVREGFKFQMISSTWTLMQGEPILHQFGADILDPSGRKCVANSEAAVRAMRLRASYALEHKIEDPTVSVATNPLPANDFAEGKVSMFITHPGSVAQFGPERMKNVKVVPLPALDPKKPVTVTYGFALALNPDISPERQKAVHELVRFVVKNPKEWLARVGTINPFRGLLEIPGVRDHPYIDTFVHDVSAARPMTRSEYYLEIADAMHRAVQRIVLNRMDPKRSLDQACQEIDQALGKS
jgi:ABC-type glycerol-3-phosphate transport system substrate-binding protein